MSKLYTDSHRVIEAALFSAGEPLSVSRIQQLFPVEEQPTKDVIRSMLKDIENIMSTHGIALVEVGSGFRFQARSEFSVNLKRLWEKKPPKYSRALLETLALIVYRQPITRSEIEDVRGVAVSTNIIKTLQDREWIKVLGTKDVPGKPSLFGTTKHFLDDFNLKSLTELPPLREVMDLEEVGKQLTLNFESPESQEADTQNLESDSDLNPASDEAMSEALSSTSEDASDEAVVSQTAATSSQDVVDHSENVEGLEGVEGTEGNEPAIEDDSKNEPWNEAWDEPIDTDEINEAETETEVTEPVSHAFRVESEDNERADDQGVNEGQEQTQDQSDAITATAAESQPLETV